MSPRCYPEFCAGGAGRIAPVENGCLAVVSAGLRFSSTFLEKSLLTPGNKKDKTKVCGLQGSGGAGWARGLPTSVSVVLGLRRPLCPSVARTLWAVWGPLQPRDPVDRRTAGGQMAAGHLQPSSHSLSILRQLSFHKFCKAVETSLLTPPPQSSGRSTPGLRLHPPGPPGSLKAEFISRGGLHQESRTGWLRAEHIHSLTTWETRPGRDTGRLVPSQGKGLSGAARPVAASVQSLPRPHHVAYPRVCVHISLFSEGHIVLGPPDLV